MKTIDKEMERVVTCKICGEKEYYGMMHWSSFAGQVCRACIYREWQASGHGWKPTENDYTFPLYDDGKDYQENSDV